MRDLLAIEGLRRRIGRQTTGGLGNIARAFAHRNYLVYVSGNSISLIGWRKPYLSAVSAQGTCLTVFELIKTLESSLIFAAPGIPFQRRVRS
ncbi:MAG TPA: hypothetical protein VKB88_28760 [Bryobacteraceae bacterium]|nr:hypothetical protein [Bryobacteraceae bacterium]